LLKLEDLACVREWSRLGESISPGRDPKQRVPQNLSEFSLMLNCLA